MSIRITYPNNGLYEGGKPRYEVFDDKTGEITACRLATPEEALIAANTDAMHRLSDLLVILNQQITSVQTYGLRSA